MDDPVKIQFALVSHTNNGKTTLARTLVGMDVGEVRDAAHVTQFAEAHLLQTSAAGDSLVLWDTPGFGDSVRLLKRLSMSGNPIGWFLREVFDRYRDKPFWLSQQALRAAKEEADVVLYLVNSSEAPQDAGYLPSEMKILEWLGKPVAVLLNQMGPPRPGSEEAAEQGRWKQHLASFPVVKEVLPLDAFARCWVHEHVFYDAIGKLIEPARQAGYARLLATWEDANQRRYRNSLHLVAELLAFAARDRQEVSSEGGQGLFRSALKAVGLGKDEQKRQELAMATLVQRLNDEIGSTTARMLVLHKLDPGKAGAINARVRENFAVRAPVDRAQAGLLGAMVSGAATGLSADLMAGGLTLGGGALLGAIVGALTMAGAAWGFNVGTDRNQHTVQFADAFLQTLLTGGLLRYLAVAHFGRGRGNYVESEAPAFWQAEVERAVAAHAGDLPALWRALRAAPDGEAAIALAEKTLVPAADAVLAQLYPAAALPAPSQLTGTGIAR
ncbi:GTPase domain-containing protein [Massilia oculi]|uniref:GTPase domain-containing protein n=1 Tax=Massilia hydrophila TaxID=3044279 RepID=A0ABS7YFE7_9BURK|nr:GTPase domain-containing protein [Massilia oculi]MCA1858431.1 GTPase domain-containing protein [Massilia oculi]